jgi:hypothetical protein
MKPWQPLGQSDKVPIPIRFIAVKISLKQAFRHLSFTLYFYYVSS